MGDDVTTPRRLENDWRTKNLVARDSRAPQRTYPNHVLIRYGSSSHPILKKFRSNIFARGRRKARARAPSSCHQMSVKMRESADVVMFPIADQKYFTSARFRAVQRWRKVSRPKDTGRPSRFACEIYLREKFSKSGNRTSWMF